METKVCSKCNEEKPLTEYYLRKNRNNSPHSVCKECIATEAKQKRLAAMSPEQLEKFQWRLEQEFHHKIGKRKCQTCLELKHLEEYERGTGSKKYTSCSSCRPEVSKEYFDKNPHQQIKRHQGVLTNREFVKTYTLPLKEAGCADCKQYYPDAMEFDHTCPPSEKLYNIARIHNAPGSSENMLSILEAELAKGEYVCVNCHTIRTHSRQRNNSRVAYVSGVESIYLTFLVKGVYEILATSCCTDCRENNFLVLEFDHVRGKKTANVSWMMKHPNIYTKEDINDEIAKCDIRCGNCHRMRTAARQRRIETTEQIPKDATTGRCNCGNRKSRESLICNDCHLKGEYKRTSEVYGELDALVQRLKVSNFTKLGKELGVTDNAIRKHLRRNGVDPKTLLPVVTDEDIENRAA